MDTKGKKSSAPIQQESKKRLLRLLIIIGIITAIGASVPILSNYEWSGFGKDSNKSESREETIKDGKVISTKRTKTEYFQSPKTLWDWLGLGGTIAIPIMIYVFQAGEQRRALDRADAEKEAATERAKVEKEIADANLREEALQAYIDRMADILIDQNCRSELLPDKYNSNHTNTDNAVRDVARTRTTTVLRRLEGDKERQEHVLDFLRDAELLDFILSGAKLSNANLVKAYLKGANLSGANLFYTNLSSANLGDANLTLACCGGTNFSGAKLKNANLNGAKLKNTNLTLANLSNANLSGANFMLADLSGADLSGANLTDVENLTVEQVKAAKNWETAKYNPKFRKLLGLPSQTNVNQKAPVHII